MKTYLYFCLSIFCFLLMIVSPLPLDGQNLNLSKIDNQYLDDTLKSLLEQTDFLAGKESLSPDSIFSLVYAELNLITPLDDTTKARVFHKIGAAFHNRGNYLLPKTYYKLALNMRKGYFPKTHPDIIKGYNNIGSSYLELTRSGEGFFLDSAEFFLQSSLRLNLKRGIPTNIIGDTYINLSRMADEIGDVDNAVFYLNSAISHLEKDRTKSYNLAVAQNDLASIYAVSLNKLDSAKKYAEASKKYFQHQDLTKWWFRIPLGDVEVNEGSIYLQQGSFDQALSSYKEALRLKSIYLDDSSIHSQIADIYNNLGIVKNRQGNFEEGLDWARKAIDLNQDSQNYLSLGRNYNNQGDACLGLGQLDSALESYQNSIFYFAPEVATSSSGNPTIRGRQFLDPKGLLNSLSSKAKTLSQIYHHSTSTVNSPLVQAFHTLQKCDTLIQILRHKYKPRGSKVSLSAYAKPFYEVAIDVCVELAKSTKDIRYKEFAFQYAEKSKSVILLEAIRNAQAIESTLPESIQEKLKKLTLKKEYFENGLARSLIPSKSRSEINAFQDSVIKYRLLASQFLSETEASFPSYFNLVYRDRYLTIQEIRKKGLVSADKGLIEYFVGENHIFCFLITQSDYLIKKIKRDFPLEELIQKLRYSISSPEALDDIPFYANLLGQHGSTLYDKLLGIWGDLDVLPKRMTIVRDDVTELLPFEVLLIHPVEEGTSFSEFPYLIKNKIISYAFSATLLQIFQDNEILPDQKLAAFAPVGFNLLNDPSLNGANGYFTDLPFTLEEINQIADPLEIVPYTKEQACLDTFYQTAPKARIIYIASHAILDNADPQFNGILLKDAILYTRHLYQMKLNADLIVLRGCQTGIGKLNPGEGTASVARGFAEAGAKSVFSTQWLVPSATRFMQKYMNYIYSGELKDEALHLVKLQELENSYPYYWAAYEVRGDMRPIKFTNPYLLTNLIIAGIVISALFFLIFYVQKKKKRLA